MNDCIVLGDYSENVDTYSAFHMCREIIYKFYSQNPSNNIFNDRYSAKTFTLLCTCPVDHERGHEAALLKKKKINNKTK